MKKRLACAILSVLMILPMQAYAVETIPSDAGEEVVVLETTINEYDAFLALINTPVSQLMDSGFTEEEIEYINSFSFEESLLERAQLSDETLHAYGYTDEEIEILRNYDGEPIVKGSAVYGILAECTGRLIFPYISSTKYMIHYSCIWDKLYQSTGLTESMAIRWLGIDDSGSSIDMIPSDTYTIIGFYDAQGNTEMHTRYYFAPDADHFDEYSSFDAIQTMFNSLDGTTNMYWAKTADFWTTLSVDDSINNETVYIKVAALYGHSSISTSPSLSFPGSVGLSFNGITEDLAGVSYVVYADGDMSPIS